MLACAGEARAGWSELVAGYGIRGPRRLGEAAHRLAGAVRDEGIVYNEYDGDATITRDWVVDAAPLMVDGTEWASLTNPQLTPCCHRCISDSNHWTNIQLCV